MSSWFPLLTYLIAMLVLGVLAFIVVLNFLRYRFRGDRTVAFISLFLGLCSISMIFTLALLKPNDVRSPQEQQDSFFTF